MCYVSQHENDIHVIAQYKGEAEVMGNDLDTVKLGYKVTVDNINLFTTNTHGKNRFNGLCSKCPGYNNNLVITAHISGNMGVVGNKFDCITNFYPLQIDCQL